jgi:hypothetical protein
LFYFVIRSVACQALPIKQQADQADDAKKMSFHFHKKLCSTVEVMALVVQVARGKSAELSAILLALANAINCFKNRVFFEEI